MSIRERQPVSIATTPPPLESGDHLDRAEFERRYLAHPEIKKAELIEGIVYVSSPVRYRQHAKPHSAIIGWLFLYRAATPCVSNGDSATLRLDEQNEVQPDGMLRLLSEYGGRSTVDSDGYIHGTPELLVEIAASSASYDLHSKRRVYARSGIPEYLIIQPYKQQVEWSVLHQGKYVAIAPDEQGILRSQIFPGLWLRPSALWANELAVLINTLQEGLNSPEHRAFVEKLQAKQG